MTTLISSYNSEGCVGRCDAKCYDASEPDCTCICQGRNHGKGRQQALDNTREYCEAWIKRAQQRDPRLTGFEVAPEATCDPLF